MTPPGQQRWRPGIQAPWPGCLPPGRSPAPGAQDGLELPASDSGLPGPPTEPQSGHESLGPGAPGGCPDSAFAVWGPPESVLSGPASSLPVPPASQLVSCCLHPAASSSSLATHCQTLCGCASGGRWSWPRPQPGVSRGSWGGSTAPHSPGAGALSEERRPLAPSHTFPRSRRV